ncbi:MAG: hypothetical protein CL780_01380 [Chloroflexi bacterium]|nr:hypothetical protein [Chloroflexota bacterium]|tara:strand:+ start:1153 stop:1959 length:807 start_codon:yes stop_codon:yes gene_type:complete
MGLLDKKNALITGSRKGIGRGIALRFASEGANVGINDIVNDEISHSVVEESKNKGVRSSFLQYDVSTVNGIESLIDEFVNQFGSIDILINNAILQPQDRNIWEVDELFWDKVMNLSLKAYFFGAKRAAKHMISQGNGGKIISLASVHAYAAMPDWTIYGVAKSGLIRMAKGLSVDLRGKGININCIAPGAISNSLPKNSSDFSSVDGIPHPDSIAKDLPTQRGGLPSDIANAALYLCSDLGSYVNGETILVDGGMIAAAPLRLPTEED